MMDEKISQRLDMLDEKIVALFEQRLVVAQKAMTAMTKRELRREARALGAQAVEKATSYACDVSSIAYTEELIKLMLCASLKHQRRLLRRAKKQCGC
jgi:hypothetical protein